MKARKKYVNKNKFNIPVTTKLDMKTYNSFVKLCQKADVSPSFYIRFLIKHRLQVEKDLELKKVK